MNPFNQNGPPGPIPQNQDNGPPVLNLQAYFLDLRTMEELCQPTMVGRGGPIAPMTMQATDFGLKNRMIQQTTLLCVRPPLFIVLSRRIQKQKERLQAQIQALDLYPIFNPPLDHFHTSLANEVLGDCQRSLNGVRGVRFSLLEAYVRMA
ncbi:hypothetical protein Tco_0074009 [Tanacetum coccineum]